LAANSTAPLKEKRQVSVPPALIVAVLGLVAGLAGFLYLNHAARQPPPPVPPLTGAAKEYVRHGFLPISDFHMEAHESYLKQQVVEITGKIGNTGDRVIDTWRSSASVYDPYGQMVLRSAWLSSSRADAWRRAKTSRSACPSTTSRPVGTRRCRQMVIARIEILIRAPRGRRCASLDLCGKAISGTCAFSDPPRSPSSSAWPLSSCCTGSAPTCYGRSAGGSRAHPRTGHRVPHGAAHSARRRVAAAEPFDRRLRVYRRGSHRTDPGHGGAGRLRGDRRDGGLPGKP